MRGGGERRGPIAVPLATLVLGAGGGALRGALGPAAAALAALAAAGAAAAGAAPGGLRALVGPAALLAAPAVAATAAAILHARVRGAVLAGGGLWRDLQARGASYVQTVLLAAGAPALLVLALGVLLPLPLALLITVLPLHSGHAGLGAALAGGWSVSLPGAAVLAALVLAAAARTLGAAGAHSRAVSSRPLWRRRWGDALLAAVGLALMLGARAAAGLPTGPVLGGLGGALFAVGAALGAVRAAGALAGAWERRLPDAPPALLLALRSAARGAGAVWPVALAALAAYAVAFSLTGGPAAASSARALQSAAVGADVRLRETFPRPCGACTGFAATVRTWPLPDVAGVNLGLPGVAGAATEVSTQDALRAGAAGRIAVVAVGIEPQSFAAVAEWPSGAGRGAAQRLAATPDGVVVSTAVAAAAGLSPGARVQSVLLGELTVVGVVPVWPGIASAGPDWIVVNWSRLAGPLQARGAWTPAGFSADLLLRLSPGAQLGSAVSALSGRRIQVSHVVLRSSVAAGSGPLPLLLWPLALLAAALWWGSRATVAADAGALPTGLVATATGASEAAAAAGAVLTDLGPGLGATVGCLAAAIAGWLLWPGLAGFLTTAAPLSVPPLGLFLALPAVLWIAYRLRGTLSALPVPVPDPLVAERLTGRAAGRPEPPPASPAPPPPAAGRREAARTGGGFALRSLLAVLIPAGKRLRAHWSRLLGLAAGLLLAAAVAATVPLYVAGSLTRVLHAGLTPVNDRPAGATLISFYPPSDWTYTPADLSRLASLAAGAGTDTALPATPVTDYQATGNGNVSALPTPGLPPPVVPYIGSMTVDALSGLAAHVQVASGRMYANAPASGGVLEAVATQAAAQSLGLQLGRLYQYSPADGGGNLTIRLVGVIQQVDPTGAYWPYRYYSTDFLVSPNVLSGLIAGGAANLGEAAWYTTLDMRSLNAETVPAVLARLQRFGLQVSAAAPGANLDVSPYKVLSDFVAREHTLQALLRLVSIPVIALALYFVAITASLIVAAEESEIAVYVSRGAGTLHILALYLLEWCMLAVPAAALAPFPAALFARAMGAASGFLSFTHRTPLPVLVTGTDFVYSGAIALCGVATALLPVIGLLGRSIISQRLRSSRAIDQPLWQRAYLDVAALGAMAVLWLIFRGVALQPGGGAASIVADPALYLLPAAFLVVAGLLIVRFVGWVLRTLDALVGAWAGPGLLVPLRRIGRLPAQFAPVLLLLSFTAALGAYSAAAARTLNANLTSAVLYRVGGPVQLQEVSPCISLQPEVGACLTYDNAPIGRTGTRPLPPFSLHASIPGIAAATEIVSENVVLAGVPGQPQADLVLIDPATYAAVGWWMDGLNPYPLSTYLNVLRQHPDAVFVSGALHSADRVPSRGAMAVQDQISGLTANLQAMGPINLWPGAGISGPFLLGNLNYARGVLGIVPASRTALLRLSPGASLSNVVQGLGTRAIFVSGQNVAAPEVAAALATPEWAGQSGMLTVGFLVALAVTVLGYLFYASLLLRRQLRQLGLLRALGLPWGQLVATVALEQGTLLVAGAAAGTVAGLIAAVLFLPLFQPAFSGPYTPPFISAGPGPALGQVAAVMLVLLAVALLGLLLLVRRMHIGETVKLEE